MQISIDNMLLGSIYLFVKFIRLVMNVSGYHCLLVFLIMTICFSQNVIISVVGGLQVKEPAVDLAVAVALCSRLNS